MDLGNRSTEGLKWQAMTPRIATARSNQSVMHRVERFGDIPRHEIQMNAVQIALEMLRERIR